MNYRDIVFYNRISSQPCENCKLYVVIYDREIPKGESCSWTMRPVLSHKVACLGNSQSRILESWGNRGKCEIVGIPRLDNIKAEIENKKYEDIFSILVCTANTPGYTNEQIENTEASLKDLNKWLLGNRVINEKKIKIIWRLTSNLDQKLNLKGDKSNYKTENLADALLNVNAVITTPSTVMLEAV